MTESPQKEKIDRMINAAQLVFAELLDSELYLPVKQELAEMNVNHSLGFKKELFKSKVEILFQNLKTDLENNTPEEIEVIDCAVAFIDQLNSFNDFNHPEVHKRALELQKAVAEYLKPK